MPKALKVTVKNSSRKKAGMNPVDTGDTNRLNLNNKIYGLAKSNEKTFMGKIANRVGIGARTMEKGMEFISGSSSRMSKHKGMKRAIKLGMKHSLIKKAK